MYGKWKERMAGVMEAYGVVALVTHYSLGALFFLAVALARNRGWMFATTTAAADAGIWAGAYLIYKATMLPRMMITAVLTPFIARLVGRSPRPAP